MALTLQQLAKMTGAQLVGDGTTIIENAAPLVDAKPGDITLLDNVDRPDLLMDKQMSAVVMPVSELSVGIPTLQCTDAHAVFAQIVREFRPQHKKVAPFISPQAYVDPTAKLGKDVTIYPFVFIGPEVEVGERTIIYPNSQLMAGVKVGTDTTIHSNVTIYSDCQIGSFCILHAGVSIGANGFGYSQKEGRHVLSAQLGNVELSDYVEVGANSTIDRGAYGATRIGEGTKIDNLVMVGHNCQIGKHNLLCAQVGVAGSTSTGDYVVMAGQVGVRDHVHIGTGAILGAKCGVMTDVTAGAKMLGTPACPEREQMIKFALTSKLPEMRRSLRKLEQQVKELEDAQTGKDA